MANSVAMKLACMVVMCMVVCAPLAEALTCVEVAGTVSQCIGYLRSGGAVPVPCCSGVKSLNAMANNTPNRRVACNCLISAAKNIPGLKPNLVSGLPGACGVKLPFPISISTNCAKIN
ncbi:hypothetical protein FNV43_RR08670 [Rhamnella rubrinervis]|uniref:Non-specific lipid-transfer protein n=1 Tax=Rhamnella rubrinervis TaxID=2594499 RepID=A0A8K0H9C3_9ROSA|nr:hypothetical protein FNV43_RR08670 [Rhamnella rubrinervis]